MEPLIAAVLGSLVSLGAVLIVIGLIPRQVSTTESTTLWKRLLRLWESWSNRRRAWVIGSLLTGVLVGVTTGWLIAILLLPAALLAIPVLLSEPPQPEITTLAGLDRWVRLLSASIATGKSIRDAIIVTRNQVPASLQAAVLRLVARCDQGWSTRDALLEMADELSSADADAVLAALAIAASRGGVGTRATLTALCQNTQQRLAVLREIAAERAKPRAVVRQVTIITLGLLSASVLFSSSFFAPYASPLGQVIALLLAACYLGCLVMLRRKTIPQPAARFLKSEP